jgi:hypothetical protein
LDPGDRWQQELYRNIDNCDLFLLFWSTWAKNSEWVRKEVGYALDRKGWDDLSPPEIRPVIVQPPPAFRRGQSSNTFTSVTGVRM